MVRVTFETRKSEIRKESEKLTFEYDRSTGANFFSRYYQEMRQG